MILSIKKNYLTLIICVLFLSNLMSQTINIDSLKKAYFLAKNDTTKCNILNILINSEEDMKPWFEYNIQLDSLCNAILKNYQSTSLEFKKFKNYQSKALNNIAFKYEGDGAYSEALKFHLKAIEIKKVYGDEKTLSHSYNRLGLVYFREGNITKAFENLKIALSLRIKINDKEGISSVYFNYGNIYYEISDYTKAIDYFFKSLKLKKELKDFEAAARLEFNIANVYLQSNDTAQAIKIFNNLIHTFKSIKKESNAALVYSTLSLIYNAQNKHSMALSCINNAIGLSNSISNKVWLSNIYCNSGLIYLTNKDFIKSNEAYQHAILINENNGNKQGLAEAYNGIGDLKNIEGKTQEALIYFNKAYTISKELGFYLLIRNVSENLFRLYKKTGDFKKSLKYYEIFSSMKDSISKDKNLKASVQAQYRFDYEKKSTQDSLKVIAEKKLSQIKLEKEKTMRYTLYGGLTLISLFSIFIFNRFKITQKQKNIIEQKEQESQKQNIIISEQKNLVELKHKEITDSINYAERIQRSLLANMKLLNEHLKDYFIFFKPKDIVSGDFYWASKIFSTNKVENFAIVTADSTGHGVPGAIMSILNIACLNESVKEGYTLPNEILNRTRKEIISVLERDGSEGGGKDGMDCSICVYDFKNMKLYIAAANNPVWIVRSRHCEDDRTKQSQHPNEITSLPAEARNDGTEVIEIKPDKMPVGKHDKDKIPFTLHEVQLQKGDVVYTLTDGFPDQFGGEKGKKFMSKNLRELLAANAYLPMQEQKQLLEKTFADWVGDMEQVDDVTIIGVRV